MNNLNSVIDSYLKVKYEPSLCSSCEYEEEDTDNGMGLCSECYTQHQQDRIESMRDSFD